MRPGRVEVVLSPGELERLDRVAAERGTNRSEVVRTALALLGGRPAAPMGADEVVALIEGHARRGNVRCALFLGRCFGLHRAAAPGARAAAAFGADAFAEVDALAEGRRARAADAEWLVDPESERLHAELRVRRALGPGAT
jgi:Ribbon-helix-helix protein, copG family